MLTAFAKSVFNPDGPKVDKDGTLGQEAPDNAPVITGNGGIASMAEELAAINEELRQRSGKPLGKYVSNYKDAENMLKSQLAEDAYEMEDDLSKAAASGKVSGSKLTALEQQEYDRLKAKLEGAEELEEEFDTTADMANTIAEDYGQDVEITVEDQAGHEYAVKSDLKHTKFFVPSNSEMQANAQAIAEKMSSGGGYDINAGQESVLQWEAEEADAKAQQMEEDMGDDVEVVYPNVQNPPPPALPVDHQQKQPAQQKQPVQESMAGTMTGESTTAVVPQQLDDEVPDYEELEEAAEEGFTWPEYEKELKWRQEHPEDGKPVERFKGRKVPEPAAGTKLGDGFIEAEDTNITEGIAEGREAEANTLMTWDELQHFERENLHSPRIRFRINVLAIPNSPADGNVNGKSEVVLAEPFSDIYIKSVSGCLVKV